MIDRISGTVQSVWETSITVDVGNIGLLLQVPNPSCFEVGQKVDLFAHMHWNQEQGPTLFGFETELQKRVFLLVISCSGIGPKIGLAVLRDLGPEQFLEAVQMNEDRVLSKVGGLGPKKVEQMIVQLKRKVEKLIKSGVELKGATKFTDWQNVSDALVSLNYSRNEISRAMKFLTENHAKSNLPFDGLIRHALSFLAKNR
ncbi:Holliday junction branch migration protein RuvA [Candidatus Dependentiae bacterium]